MRDMADPEPMTEVRIQVDGLRLSVGGDTLLDVPALDLVGAGPTLILGPNGAGKSLLMRCLHGLIAADCGQIRQGGVAIGAAQRARQAMVFQKPVLLRRSVAANLDFVLKRQRLARAVRRDRIAALLAGAGLGAKAGQAAHSLSGGEAQRLALLRALATGPDILFLDEPTSALDPAATHVIEAMIQGAARHGTRIVMITHDIGQARRLARDIVLMRAGQVAEHTPADIFFDAPRTEAARRFLAGELVF
jgi:tungstate transport system ATP-binding protein